MAKLRIAIIAITIGMMLFSIAGCGKAGLGGKAPDPRTVTPPSATSPGGAPTIPPAGN